MIPFLTSLFVASVVAMIVFLFVDQNHVNHVNEQFTRTCNAQHGSAVISEKDLCIAPDGRVLFHE